MKLKPYPEACLRLQKASLFSENFLFVLLLIVIIVSSLRFELLCMLNSELRRVHGKREALDDI